jgi:type II secretory pathway component GspD/PulD (secretin)
MRTRSLLLASLVLAAVGCRSTESPPPGQPMQLEAPAPAPVYQEGQSQDAAEQVQRLRERQAYLAEQYIARGDELLDRMDLQGALNEYSQAYQVMPSNETARERMGRVRALLGDDYANAGLFMDDAVERERIRRTQARFEAEQLSVDGDNFMRLGEHEHAIEAYRRAETILRFHPLIADESLDEQLVSAKLATALEAAEAGRQEREAQLADEARRERLAAEEEARTYRETKLRTLYTEANNAFNREQYGLAETLADQVLLYDPGNEHAAQLREIAQSARHQRTREGNARAYRENWIKTFDELNHLGIPQTDSIDFDLSRWKSVRERTPYAFSEQDVGGSADKDAITRRLADTRVSARFGVDGDGAPLEEVAGYLQNVSGVNFVISPKVRDELDVDETSVLLDLPERSVLSLLNIITEVRENLSWKIEDGVVKFVTAEELLGGQVLRMYEVRDIIHPISDFPGREININPSGGVPEISEDFEEREGLVLAEDALDTLIRDNVATDSWDADVANSLSFSSGTMVVSQTPEVQEQIQALLDDLREATGIMVDIQARFLKVEDNFLEDIGVDFRGLGAPGKGTNTFFDDFGNPTAQQTLGNEIGNDTSLGAFYDDGADGDIRGRTENLYDTFLGDEDVLTGSGGLQFQWTYLDDLQLQMVLTAVSKSERVELVTAPRVLVFNTARSNLSVMNQVAYVQDFDVEIAQAASIADPIISVVEDGVVLDVRPVVSADRRYITLELRPTVAELQRPIETFTTSLGVSGNSVTIQLPELDISRVRTSIPMPDGSTVLLGGMKIHDEQDLRSGVPILNQVPIISFFFQKQGTFITNRKLLVLIKAKILIPTEHEPTPSQLGLDESLQLEPR